MIGVKKLPKMMASMPKPNTTVHSPITFPRLFWQTQPLGPQRVDGERERSRGRHLTTIATNEGQHQRSLNFCYFRNVMKFEHRTLSI